MIWTKANERELLDLHGQGWSRAKIATHFDVTRNTICGKIHRLMKSRPQPFDLRAHIEDCYWPAKRMKALVSEMLGEPEFQPNDRLNRAGLFLFGALLIGRPYSPWVAMVTGLDRRECCWFGIRARRANIIKHRIIDAGPWLHEDALTATINFVLDCSVVAETMSYQGERGPDRLYGLPEWRTQGNVIPIKAVA